MSSEYEVLLNMAREYLSPEQEINDGDIADAVEVVAGLLRRRKKINILEDDIQKAISELSYFFAVSITDEDTELFEKRINSSWWTDSFETRKKDGKNYYWDSYKKFLLEKEKLSTNVVERIDERSDKVMNYLFDPMNPDIKDATRRGMVIGSVQSGKTANYSALIAKAADAGYKIIIVIAGISSILRKQTQFRINCGFVGQTDLNKDEAEKIIEKMSTCGTVTDYRRKDQNELERFRPYAMTTERIKGDFRKNSRKALNQTNLNNVTSPIILVIKKNTNVLEQVLEWLDGKDLSEKSLLLVDDEADNASINTKKEYEQQTKINEKIRNILKKFRKSAYVGFTATPFANIFIDPMFDENSNDRDLYPSDFIISLASPDNYFGPQKVFGYEEIKDSKYIIELPADQTEESKLDWAKYFPVKQKKGQTVNCVDGIPESLKEAINLFIFNIYVRNSRGFSGSHNSMLIHVSYLVDMHNQIKEKVCDYLSYLENNIKIYAGMRGSLEYNQYIAPLEKLFNEMLNKNNWAISQKFEKPCFNKMLPELSNIISSIDVGVSNVSEASIKYSMESQTNMIAIGGNSLARGFTIENLSVSYFLRNTKMCDTLLQMGRWFGYRRDYDDLCKVYTTERYYDNFHNALIATNSLVSCIKKMEKSGKTPIEFLVTVSQHPATRMILTAKNKMYNAENDKGVFLDGTISEKGTYSHCEIKEISSYFSIVEEFITQLGTPENGEKYYRWQNISADKISTLIEICPISFSDKIDSELLVRYINENRNFNWRVVLPYAQNGNKIELSNGEISFCKFKRYDKLENDIHSRSFAVSDISHERFGCLDDEYTKDDTRQKLRAKRKEPLLIINIFDLYEYIPKENRKNQRNILIQENFPFFSLSFPGSFENPKFKPLTNFVYNKKIQEKLQEEIRDQEENFDYMDIEYE